MYNNKIQNIVEKIDNLIIDELTEYDTEDLENIVECLVDNHSFTTKDSIQNLIYTLERLQDYY